MFKNHIVVVTDSIIVCGKVCREDIELWSTRVNCVWRRNGQLGTPRLFSSQQLRDVLQLLRSGNSDVISQAGRGRSTSSRGAEKDVKSTSRGEEFQEEFVLP